MPPAFGRRTCGCLEAPEPCGVIGDGAAGIDGVPHGGLGGLRHVRCREHGDEHGGDCADREEGCVDHGRPKFVQPSGDSDQGKCLVLIDLAARVNVGTNPSIWGQFVAGMQRIVEKLA